jgi:hypothetical protein
LRKQSASSARDMQAAVCDARTENDHGLLEGSPRSAVS